MTRPRIAATWAVVAIVGILVGCASSPAANQAGPAKPAASSPASSAPSATASASSVPSASSAPATSAWLSASEMPFNSTYAWSLFTGTANEAPIGTSEGNGVFYISPDTVFQAITSCGDPSLILSQPLGARQREFMPTSGPSQDLAGEFISSYPAGTAAQAAWRRLQAVYAGCQAGEGNPQITVTETAQAQDAMAWFHSTNGEMVGDLAPYSHEYFVLHGTEIAYVYVEGGGSALATTPDDAQVLAVIARHLNG